MSLTRTLKHAAISLGLLLVSATAISAQSTPGDSEPVPSRPGAMDLWLSPRLLPIGSEPRTDLTFKSQQLDRQLQLYRQYLAVAGPPDILIVGSSRSLAGIDPIALQQALARQGRPGIRVFNFGVNGATAQVVDLILQAILTPEELPKLIIWGDGVRAFNSGRPDITYNGILSSSAYQQLMAQAQPRPPMAKPGNGQACMGLSWGDVTRQVARQPLSALIMAAFTRQSLPQSCSQGVPMPVANPPTRLPGAEQAWSQVSGRLPAAPLDKARAGGKPEKTAWSQNSGQLEQAGFLEITIQFDPATYYRTHPRVPGAYDADYRNFDLGGEQATALQRLITFTRSRQIPLIFVNLPLTSHYLDPARTAYEQEFVQMLESVADEETFWVRNLNQPQLARNPYFIDPSHLNRYGAIVIANQLARDPSLPWSRLASPTASSMAPMLRSTFSSHPLQVLLAFLSVDWWSNQPRIISQRLR